MQITAGGSIYIALSDLVPELQKNRTNQGVIQVFAIIGVALMTALLIL